MIRVIQAIQKAKAAQAAFGEISPSDRVILLRQLKEQVLLNTKTIISWENPALAASDEFLQTHIIKASLLRIDESIAELQQNSAASAFSKSATGLISILLPSVMAFRVLLERLVPALAAGNVVLVKLSSKGADWSSAFSEMLKAAGFAEGVCQLIHGSADDVGSLMATHPALRAVSFAGRYVTAEAILKMPGLIHKKIQFSTGGNNSAIMIGEDWDQHQLEILVESCVAGGGNLPWNTNKIFVTESVSKKFIEDFLSQIGKRQINLSLTTQLEKFEQQIQAIKNEGGKSLSISPAVFLDLSHCSVFQQDELLGPTVLISTVKYLHESIKWANTGYLGMTNLILGPEDKALRAAQKLECGHVWINSWLKPEDGVISGVKQSAAGDMDFGAFGSFYSDRKKIVGAQSK